MTFNGQRQTRACLSFSYLFMEFLRQTAEVEFLTFAGIKTVMLNLSIVSSPAKRELNGSNDIFLEADILKNYWVNRRSSCFSTNTATSLFFFEI